MGKPPKSSILIGFSMKFTIHFGGKIPLFLEVDTHMFIAVNARSKLPYIKGVRPITSWLLTKARLSNKKLAASSPKQRNKRAKVEKRFRKFLTGWTCWCCFQQRPVVVLVLLVFVFVFVVVVVVVAVAVVAVVVVMWLLLSFNTHHQEMLFSGFYLDLAPIIFRHTSTSLSNKEVVSKRPRIGSEVIGGCFGMIYKWPLFWLENALFQRVEAQKLEDWTNRFQVFIKFGIFAYTWAN